MSILIAYASKHGATEGIAEGLGATLRQLGLDVAIHQVDVAGDPKPYHAVIIGSAVYMGRWMQEAGAYVRRYRETLSAQPVWLFSSGPVGAAALPDPKEVAEFQTLIHPREHHQFAGALDRHHLSFAERVIVSAVKAPDGDYRRWDEINDWAVNIARGLSVSAGAGRMAAVAPVLK